jgi:anaerobic carbon-monoxide dehydrogenase iron sulfur subunit
MPHVMVANRRCTGCRMCELACSAFHEGAYQPSLARLHVEVNPTSGTIKGHSCLQSSCSRCQKACPNDAIAGREVGLRVKGDYAGKEKVFPGGHGYVLVVDESRCDNCGACYDVCPTGVIHEHPDRHVAFKCDLCDGEPQCIAFCQNPHSLAIDLRADSKDRSLCGG